MSSRGVAINSKTFIAFMYKNSCFLCGSISVFLALVICLDPRRFASHYEYVEIENIVNELEKSYPQHNNSCAINVSRENHKLSYPNQNPEEEDAAVARRLDVLPGGQWQPSECNALFKVAIIICYRNRKTQLKIFLNYIHPFLQRQCLEYQIFVVEQSPERDFNRAKLFNVGFAEAIKVGDFKCFIFHDIDLIPQNPNNIYACTKMPRHMSSSVNTFRYNLPYTGLFGGVIAISRAHFEKVNGFSNVYYGWGGEDDDFYQRLQVKGLKITRFSPKVAQYYMLNHKREAPSKLRYAYLKMSSQRMDTDGIVNLEYKGLDTQLRPLYTWILADV